MLQKDTKTPKAARRDAEVLTSGITL